MTASSVTLYNEIELDEVMSASSHRLIQMLYDRCLYHMRMAQLALNEKRFDKKRHAISKASDIVVYLRSCLNFEAQDAKDLSRLLDSIYASIEKRLLLTTIKNDPLYLDDAINALQAIKEGWDAITPQT